MIRLSEVIDMADTVIALVDAGYGDDRECTDHVISNHDLTPDDTLREAVRNSVKDIRSGRMTAA